jgi:hypothetical protein
MRGNAAEHKKAADYYVSSVRAAVNVCLEASAAFEKRASAVSN